MSIFANGSGFIDFKTESADRSGWKISLRLRGDGKDITFRHLTKADRRLFYRIRRAKFALASIAFVVSCTLLFIAERPASAPWIWLVAGVYIVSGLWLVIRFAPRDDEPKPPERKDGM